jgi:hypothetical protein
MLIRWLKTEDTPYRHVDAGTQAETDEETAKRLIAEGIAVVVPAKAERAVKPKGEKAVKQ